MMSSEEQTIPKYIVRSLKRPYRTDKIGDTHDRWVVGIRNEEDIPRKYDSKYDSDYNKKQAKEKAREKASQGERIEIRDMDGNKLRVEEAEE